MKVGFLLAIIAVCVICRAIIFKKHEISPIWSFIPIVNKYKLGKLTGSKLLAKLNAIVHPLFFLSFSFSLGLELWIMTEYAYSIQIPKDGTSDSIIKVSVPQEVANVDVWSKYILIAVAVIAIVVWCITMWKYTIQHEANPWWILLWAVIPVIPYIAFAASSKTVINGKLYTTKRVEIGDIPKKKKKNTKIETSEDEVDDETENNNVINLSKTKNNKKSNKSKKHKNRIAKIYKIKNDIVKDTNDDIEEDTEEDIEEVEDNNIVEEVESEDDKKSGFMSKFKEKFSKRKKNQYAKDDEEST